MKVNEILNETYGVRIFQHVDFPKGSTAYNTVAALEKALKPVFEKNNEAMLQITYPAKPILGGDAISVKIINQMAGVQVDFLIGDFTENGESLARFPTETFKTPLKLKIYHFYDQDKLLTKPKGIKKDMDGKQITKYIISWVKRHEKVLTSITSPIGSE